MPRTKYTFTLHQQLLAVAADQGLGQEGREVQHDLAQQRADGPQRRLQLVRERGLSRGAVARHGRVHGAQPRQGLAVLQGHAGCS